jgi:hypothetical protein
MNKKIIKPEIMWAIWNPDIGFYLGTYLTRKGAILSHVLTGEISWEECESYGEMAVEVTISPVETDGHA